MKLSRAVIQLVAILLVGLVLLTAPARALITNAENASDMLGMFSSPSSDTTLNYTKACVNNGASSIGFNLETTDAGALVTNAVATDSVNHRLFVADAGNNRVLVFTLTSGNLLSSKTPANVLGQTDFVSCGGLTVPTQSSMYEPTGLAFDSTNNLLYVDDNRNSRVLVFNTSTITNGMNASYVLGEPSFTASSASTTQSGLKGYIFGSTGGIALDTGNQLLYVADNQNNRVMVFNVAPGTIASGENASYVLGQTSFTAGSANQGGSAGQSTLSNPTAVAVDTTNNLLYVGDHGNNRVLIFPTPSSASWGSSGENALYELGQPSGGAAFTTSTAATTQSGLSGPSGVKVDAPNSRVFVADGTNNRVMVFPTSSLSNGENASYVLGQASYTTRTAATTQSGLSYSSGLSQDSTNQYLYVTDMNNNRVMIYNVGTGTIASGENATDLLGQYGSLTSTATVQWTQSGYNNGPTPLGMNGPDGMALDPANHYLYVSDETNNRIMVYALNTDNSIPTASAGHTASYVIGQTSLEGTNSAATTQSGLRNSAGLAFDAANSRLFVADLSNNRVLVFNTSSLSNGMNASYVLGQAGYATATANTTQSGLHGPVDLAYDSANGRLFVDDATNSRIMVFNVAPGTIASGENATYVLGQTGFTSGTVNQGGSAGQGTLSTPLNVAYDPVNSRLFVADTGNARVLAFNVAPSVISSGENASNVLGQTSFTNTTQAATQSGMKTPTGIAYDANNSRLFVGDWGDIRLLVYNAAPGTIATGESASNILGCASYTGCSFSTTQALVAVTGGISASVAVLYDSGSGRVFLTDKSNQRVMIFDGTTISSPAQQFFLPGYE